MAQKAPGKASRNGLTLIQLFKMFPDDAMAEAWFVSRRWPKGIRCPHCGSDDIQVDAKHKTAPYRCRPCRNAGVPGKGKFSVKTGTVMHSSKIGCQKWAIAIYLFNTSLKGVSSMKLHRDLGISQKAAWHMAHRLRVAWYKPDFGFCGPVAFEAKEDPWPADAVWPTPDEMSQLLSDLNQTRRRIKELEDRRKELGID